MEHLLSLLLLPFLSCTSETKTEQQKPNIIFIFSDDHAYQAIGA